MGFRGDVLWRAYNCGHYGIVERGFFLCGFFYDLKQKHHLSALNHWVKAAVNKGIFFSLELGAGDFTYRLSVTNHAKHSKSLLTQPVALNILRSKGSPESSPSILVSEWQVAMQATNVVFTRLTLAASDSGEQKLQWREKVWLNDSILCRCERSKSWLYITVWENNTKFLWHFQIC